MEQAMDMAMAMWIMVARVGLTVVGAVDLTVPGLMEEEDLMVVEAAMEEDTRRSSYEIMIMMINNL
jgi:hypothetical protein